MREDYLFLDEEQEELESKYGCPMVELDEDELLEIVEQFVKLTPESAKWEENMQGIKYKIPGGMCVMITDKISKVL